MTLGRSKKWRDWRQHIVARCDALTRGVAPPIPLQEIVSRCHVKKVVFQPLLVEAAIAVDDDGFVVFVGCDESSRDTYQLAFNAAERQGRLPGRIRFSLAHELIHTFFYDTKQHPYANRLNGTHAKEIESLESACNFGASLLLLPTKSLKSDTYKKDILTVDTITYLAKRYQVSTECLINRLERLEEWTPKRGLIALVRQDTNGFRVKAIAKSVAIRELFENAYVDAELETAFGRVPFEAMQHQSNGALDFNLAYPGRAGVASVKCQMEYRQVTSDKKTFVLVIRVDSQPPQTPYKHKHSSHAEKNIAKLKETIKQRSVRRPNSATL